MHELALYRKYRPGQFKEVLGQEHVVDVLASSIKGKNVSHAYLFVGSRGTGKTTVARIFAKEIGVSNNDLYEIDAASNRGIDDIKELRDGVRVLPFDSKYKIYIIDEVHMLSKDAWGALLKTLEEPPKHVIFILATTEMQKVPDTIVSRCQVFHFRKPTENILGGMLAEVAKSEGYELDAGSRELISILADGSFRDALGVLQKVLNFTKGKKVTREAIEKITGAPQNSLVNQYIESIATSNLDVGLKAVKQATEQNLDMKLYFKLILEKFRLAIILRYAPKLEEEMGEDIGAEDMEFLKKLVKEDKAGVLRSQALSMLLKQYENADNAFIAELPLELALMEIIGQDK